MAHYAMATAESFQKAVTKRAKSASDSSDQESGAKSGAISGSIKEESGAISSQPEERENPDFQGESGVLMVANGSSHSGQVGDTGIEQSAISQGIRDLDPKLAQKLAQCTAKMDIQSTFETLGDKERIEAVLFLKQLREQSTLRQ